jgi:hypothetical protein
MTTPSSPRVQRSGTTDAAERLMADLVNDHAGIPYDVLRRIESGLTEVEREAASSPRAGEAEGGVRPTMNERLRALHDAYYAIPAGNPTPEQVDERLPALYAAIQGVLDDAVRISGLLATVDAAERQGVTIHVATRATCRDHLASPEPD